MPPQYRYISISTIYVRMFWGIPLYDIKALRDQTRTTLKQAVNMRQHQSWLSMSESKSILIVSAKIFQRL